VSNFKIVMLGTTGAGKTCYMLGMYSVMQIGFRGFSVTAKDLDEDLELSDKWEALVNGQGEDRWPAGNDQPHTYGFNFNYGMRPMIDFEWLDYRGGAMSDKATQNDVQVLRNYLKESSCVFLCISGEYLTGEANVMAAARKAKIPAMNFHMVELNKTINPSNSKPFPVVIIITKFDKCIHRSQQEITDDIRVMFDSLFTPNSGWLVIVCPVSVFNDKQEIEAKNVHFPLFFAIYAKLREYYLQQKEVIDGKKSTSAKPSNWLSIFSSSKGESSTPKDSTKELEEIEKKLSLLSQELKKIDRVYLSGEEIKDYVV
jgi:siroheme synthase (precorrin-2 oxidase/ferrochelatase)